MRLKSSYNQKEYLMFIHGDQYVDFMYKWTGAHEYSFTYPIYREVKST